MQIQIYTVALQALNRTVTLILMRLLAIEDTTEPSCKVFFLYHKSSGRLNENIPRVRVFYLERT